MQAGWGAGGVATAAAAQDFKYTARRLGDKEQETGEGGGGPCETTSQLGIITWGLLLGEEGAYGRPSWVLLIPLRLIYFFSVAPHGMQNSPDQISNPCPLQWKYGVLTTGPPRNSSPYVSILSTCCQFPDTSTL